jgi:heparanase 1
MTLAQGLAPSFLRLMGTDGDRMRFSFNKTEANSNGFFFPTTNFVMTSDDWDNLNTFCLKAGWRMLFGFNAQIRNKIPNGTAWDPSNAFELLSYSVKKKYNTNLDFELGNEPIAYDRVGLVPISLQKIGKDFNYLKKILDTLYTGYFKNSIIVGPDFVSVTKQRVHDYLAAVGDYLHAMTFHHYYGSSNFNHPENYTDFKKLDNYIALVKKIKNYIASGPKPNIRLWNGETSSVWPSSNTGLEVSYAAVFMLLDKFGSSAVLGIDVVIRQTFYGFNFPLVNKKLEPTPNYWVALYYKKLVGTNVLDVTSSLSNTNKNSRKFRMYAHCTQESNLYPKSSGSITIYGMNLFDADTVIYFGHFIIGSVTEIHQYLFTADTMYSKDVYLNQEILTMPSDTSFPAMKPKVISLTSEILLPGKSVVFYVLPNMKAKACLSEK